MIPIRGYCADELSQIEDVFIEASQKLSGGHALVVYSGGQSVVNLWAGMADIRDGRPWHADTPSVLFSVSKAILALGIYAAQEDGYLEIDERVSRYWPEFSCNGKEEITIRDVLSHRAGLIALDSDITTDDVIAWQPIVRAIERQRPLWQPGAGFGYHALTYGWILGEVVLRTVGMTLGDYLTKRLFRPLDADLWLPPPHSRSADRAYISPRDESVEADLVAALFSSESDREAAIRSLTLGGAFPLTLAGPNSGLNNEQILAAQVPAAGMVGTADGVARTFAASVGQVDGIRLLNPSSVSDALVTRSSGDYRGGVCSPKSRFSSGFMVEGNPERPLLSDASFGHDGALGQVAFADEKYGVGFAYLTNCSGGAQDWRAKRLVGALKQCLGVKAGKTVHLG